MGDPAARESREVIDERPHGAERAAGVVDLDLPRDVAGGDSGVHDDRFAQWGR